MAEPLNLVITALVAVALMEVDWFQYQVPLGFVVRKTLYPLQP